MRKMKFYAPCCDHGEIVIFHSLQPHIIGKLLTLCYKEKKMGKIYKIPFFYRVLRLHTNYLYRRWFSAVEVNGEENVPERASVIFAPNHQNAFTDAMALLSSSPHPVVFLAKAGIFNRPWRDKALRWLKIMPAYRMRDGIKNLKKNEDSFDQAAQVLEHKEYFCLMPEGGQEEQRKLRPLVKGMFRIGFTVQERYQDSDSVWIVPTGIDYGSYDHSGGHLVVNFGKAINLRDYLKQHQENAPVAYNMVRDELSRRMSPLMLDIRTDEYYDAFYTTAYVCNLSMLDQMGWEDNETNRLAARQRIVALLDNAAQSGGCEAELAELDKLTAQWREKNKPVEESAIAKEYGRGVDGSFLRALLHAVCMLPFAVVAQAINFVPLSIVKFACVKFSERGFYSSVSLAGNMVLVPLWHIILFLGLCMPVYHHYEATGWGWLMVACFAVILPFSYFFSYHYWWNLKFLWQRIKNLFRRDDVTPKIQKLASGIFDKVKKQLQNA